MNSRKHIAFLVLVWLLAGSFVCCQEQEEVGVLEIDGQTFRFQGIPQSVVDQFSPLTIREIRLVQRARQWHSSSYTNVYRVDIVGQLGIVYSPVSRFHGLDPLLNFLDHDAVRHDLQFTDEQAKQLKNVVSDFEAARRKWTEKKKVRPATKEKELDFLETRIASLEQANRRAANTIHSKLFLPHQQARLRELVIRFQIRKQGLPYHLTKGVLKKELSIRSNQVAQIHKTSALAAEKVRTESNRLKREWVGMLLSELTAKQRQHFKQLVVRDPAETQIPVGVLYAQLEKSSLEKLEQLEKKHPWPDFCPLNLSARFPLDSFGQLTLRQPELQDEKPWQYGYQLTMELFRVLGVRWDGKTVGRGFRDALKLSNDQSQQIAELQKLHREFRMVSCPGGTDAEVKAWLAKRQEDAKAHLFQMNSKTLAILNQEQRKILDRVVNSIAIDRIGLLPILVESKFAERLEITARQKSALLKRSDKLRQKIAEQTQEIEANYEKSLLDVLSVEQRQKYKKLVGEPVENVAANLDLIILQATSLKDTYPEKFKPELILQIPESKRSQK